MPMPAGVAGNWRGALRLGHARHEVEECEQVPEEEHVVVRVPHAAEQQRIRRWPWLNAW
jgi:hypothetical protein